MPAVEKSMTELLRQRHRIREGMDNDFFLRNLTAAADSAAESTRIMSLLLGAIASVSLLVGGIGIMNIMLVSVTERTREIGVRKAIGARRSDITWQFLLEAMTLTGAGGLLGILTGAMLSSLVRFVFPSLTTSVPLWAVVTGFVSSVSIGLFFGMWPAMKAARLDPIVALRHE
jgi:putative ABC transport system permease protein